MIISHMTVQRILADEGVTKICVWWVPKLLPDANKQARLDAVNEFLRRYCDNPSMLDRIVTGDVSWVLVCHPKSEGRHESVAQERGTIAQKMLFGSIDKENPLCSVLGFQGRPVRTLCQRWGRKGRMNSAMYVDILDTLKKRIKWKRLELLRAGVILQHDNVTLHTSRVTVKKIEDLLREVFMHPTNSPNLAPSDYHLFPALKKFLGEKQFANDEEVKTIICQWMKDVGMQFYADSINKLVRRYNKCVHVDSDNV